MRDYTQPNCLAYYSSKQKYLTEYLYFLYIYSAFFCPQKVFLPLHDLLSSSKKAFSCPLNQRHLSCLSVSFMNLQLESMLPPQLALSHISLSGIILNLCLILNSTKDFFDTVLMNDTIHKVQLSTDKRFLTSGYSKNFDKGGLSGLNFNKSLGQRNKSQLYLE